MRINNKIIIVILLFITITSCNDNTSVKKKYYKDGRIHYVEYYNTAKNIVKKIEYSEKGKIITNYSKNKKKVSMVYNNHDILMSKFVFLKDNNCISFDYYSDEIITGNGKIDKIDNMIGWWSFYDRKNILREKQEYIVVDGEQHLNQAFIYKKDGEVDLKHSKFFKINFRKKNKFFIGELIYNNKYKDSQILICIGKNIKNDFSNINKVKLDTFLFKKKGKKEFPIYLENFRNNFTGFILERHPINPKDTLSKKNIQIEQIKMYFRMTVAPGSLY